MLPLNLLAASPAYFACRSDLNSKFLRCAYSKRADAIYMEATADRVAGSARTRFILEAYNTDEQLVRVRCAYNGKYWVPQQIESHSGGRYWIVGTADEADDDEDYMSKSSSTLFQLVHHEGNSIRFYHPGLKMYACIISDDIKTSMQLRYDGSTQEDGDRRSDTFTVNGVSNHKELPKYVVFQGDNGLYIGQDHFVPTGSQASQWNSLPWYPRFYKNDRADASVLHTTFTNDEGLVRIKCESMGSFWLHVVSDDFIMLSGSKEDDRYSLFKAFDPKDGFTALQNMGTHKFCRRLSGYGRFSTLEAWWKGISFKVDGLSATAEKIDQGKLKVEEPLFQRQISDVKFHIDERRIYSKQIIHEDIESHPNITDKEETFKFQKTVTTRWKSQWATTVSMKRTEDIHSFYKMGLQLPLMKHGGLTIDTEVTAKITKEFDASHSEDGFEIREEEIPIYHEFIVPPKSRLTVVLEEINYQCDVPFSYVQRDVLLNGDEPTPTTFDDGIQRYTVTEFTAVPRKPEPLI